MRINIRYAEKSYGNWNPEDPVDVTISSGTWMGGTDCTMIDFSFSETASPLNGWANIRGGLLELPTEDARKLATAILWHLEQPGRKELRLKFKRPK